jgi:hypothetical protein
MVRGRIEVADLVLRRMGRADFIPCRFDERLQDIPDNQLLAVSLRMCERRVRHAAVRRQIASILPLFDEVCDSSALDLSGGVPAIEYHRLNEHYRTAHDLARLVLAGTSLRAIDRAGRVESHAFRAWGVDDGEAIRRARPRPNYRFGQLWNGALKRARSFSRSGCWSARFGGRSAFPWNSE